MKAFAIFVLAISASAFAGESMTANQIWQRRADLEKKTVRASLEWHYNFEVSDAHVWMSDGTVRNLAIEFDVDRVKRVAPSEWKKIADAQRGYWEKAKVAAAKKKTGPEDLWFVIDAEVEVASPAPPKEKDVILLGPDLFLKVVALYSVRLKGANQSPEPTSPSVTDRASARSAPAGAVAHL
jgi:hypothetical protein